MYYDHANDCFTVSFFFLFVVVNNWPDASDSIVINSSKTSRTLRNRVKTNARTTKTTGMHTCTVNCAFDICAFDKNVRVYGRMLHSIKWFYIAKENEQIVYAMAG